MINLITVVPSKTNKPRRVLVDGPNILKHNGGENNLKNLECLREWGRDNDVEVIIIFPKYKEYQDLFSDSTDIRLINYRINDDKAILQIANKLNLPIISNDQFRDHKAFYPSYDFAKVYPFDIVCGVLITEVIELNSEYDTENMKPSESSCFV